MLLLERGQPLVHVSGIAVNRAADAYRGEGNTEAKDAAIIANQARMRRDLRVLRLDEPAPSETTISGLAAVAVPVPSKSRVVRIAV